MTPQKYFNLNPPRVLQIDYLVSEAIQYFSFGEKRKILAERFPVPLLARCLPWCDRRSLSVNGGGDARPWGCLLLQYWSNMSVKTHQTAHRLTSLFEHSYRLLLFNTSLQNISRCNILACTVFRFPTTFKCKHWWGGGVGLGDWANFVFWVISSKIFKHRVQGICVQLSFLPFLRKLVWCGLDRD